MKWINIIEKTLSVNDLEDGGVYICVSSNKEYTYSFGELISMSNDDQYFGRNVLELLKNEKFKEVRSVRSVSEIDELRNSIELRLNLLYDSKVLTERECKKYGDLASSTDIDMIKLVKNILIQKYNITEQRCGSIENRQ